MIVKFLILPVFVWFAAAAASALPAGGIISASSYSGQFSSCEIRGRPPSGPSPAAMRVPMAGGLAVLVTAAPLSPSAQSDEIPLEPALLVVSCERMKGLFLQELGLKDEWRGKIELIINSSRPKDQGPSLTATHRLGGWSYELELPKNIQPRILVRSVMQTLLTEMANRKAGKQSADIPFWLVEGLSERLQAYHLPTFIVRPNVQSAGYNKVTIEGMKAVQNGLRGRAPLTFQQLSWPEWPDVTGKDQALYASCAELFFENLLRLDDGAASLRRMLLTEMPGRLNWQTAFLQAFHSHFPRLLDVEKWWALICTGFSEADPSQPWTGREYWHKLQEALDVPVDVYLAPSRMPAKARVTLQEVIQQWDAAAALPALLKTIRELQGLQWVSSRRDLNLDASAASPSSQRNPRGLETLQLRMSRELSPLISRYLTVLLNYVNQSQSAGHLPKDARYAASNFRWLQNETVRQLNDLDEKRAALRAKYSTASGASELSATGVHGTNSAPVSSPRLHQ